MMSDDPTEAARREMLATGQPHVDKALNDQDGGRTWTTDEVREDFDVLGFMAPFVVVTRKSDGQKGTLEFTHSPRVYFGWSADS